MADGQKPEQVENAPAKPLLERRIITCPVIGPINVYIQDVGSKHRKQTVDSRLASLEKMATNGQLETPHMNFDSAIWPLGSRKAGEVVVLTVHDLGCDHTMYEEFLLHPKMVGVRDRAVWVHLTMPGQGKQAEDLPADYQFPRMQTIGEDLIHVLNQLNIKQVVCFGEGAGANILARFAMANIERVLGVCLLHCTGTTAGFMESLKDKVISWKLDQIGVTPSAEAYLLLHRYGTLSKATNQDQLKTAIENYQETLRQHTNAKNLKKFVESFLKRTNIADNIKKLTCPVLLISGQRSLFNGTTRALHQSILRSCKDKTKVEFIEVADVANVLQERPDKLAESFQYFLQGLGLVSSAPMHNVGSSSSGRYHRGSTVSARSMSMEEYDRPLRNRTMSSESGAGSNDGTGTGNNGGGGADQSNGSSSPPYAAAAAGDVFTQ